MNMDCMMDCLFRGTGKCSVCKDKSEYVWDYTLMR